MNNRISLVAMDLDGTLTQHKQPLTPENRDALERLAAQAPLVIVGAGQVMRIFRQLEGFPIDIIGNYGMQLDVYDRAFGGAGSADPVLLGTLHRSACRS